MTKYVKVVYKDDMRYLVGMEDKSIIVIDADNFEYVSEDGYMYFFLGTVCVGAFKRPVSIKGW